MPGEDSDAHRFIREGQCLWARVSARRTDVDDGAGAIGAKDTTSFVSAGLQIKAGENWRIGGGIGYETGTTTTTSAARTETERLHLGGVLKYSAGPMLLAATLNGGFGWHDLTRVVALGGFNASATASNTASFVAGRLTAAYLFSQGAFYAKPMVEVAATHLSSRAYTERATRGIGLGVGENVTSVLSISPALEFGVEQTFGGLVTRLWARGGLTIRDKDTFITAATFADAPAGTAAFSSASVVDRRTLDVSAGIDAMSRGGIALRLQYDGQFGENTTSHGGSAKLSIPF